MLKENGTSIFTAGNEDTSYNKSRLRHFFFRVPVLMEWQQRVGRNKVFFNAGPEFEIRHSVKSFSHINGGKKKTVGKGMYVQPVGINLLAQAGYGNIGIYLRYSTYGLFQKDKGPEVSPYSFGVAWYLNPSPITQDSPKCICTFRGVLLYPKVLTMKGYLQ